MAAPHQTGEIRTGFQTYAVLAGFVILCLGVGYLGSAATTPNLEPWYAGLNKPAPASQAQRCASPVWTSATAQPSGTTPSPWTLPLATTETSQLSSAAGWRSRF